MAYKLITKPLYKIITLPLTNPGLFTSPGQIYESKSVITQPHFKKLAQKLLHKLCLHFKLFPTSVF